MRKYTLSGWILFAGLLMAGVLAGCDKPDNLPQLEIQAVDLHDQPVFGAYVALFDSYEKWLSRENPVQVWRRTDASGKVLFVDLEEKEYFFYVRSGESDNSMNEIHLDQPLKINSRITVKIHIQ